MNTRSLFVLIAALLILPSPAALGNTIRSTVGDREVQFKLVQKGSKSLLATESNELSRPPLVLNAANLKFFVETLKKACRRNEFEVNTQRYQIEIQREEKGKKIHCIYGFNSTSPQARIARDALDVLAIAINTGESVQPEPKSEN